MLDEYLLPFLLTGILAVAVLIILLYQRVRGKELVEQLKREHPDDWEALGKPRGRILSMHGPYMILFLRRRYESLGDATLKRSFGQHRKLLVVQIVIWGHFRRFLGRRKLVYIVEGVAAWQSP